MQDPQLMSSCPCPNLPKLHVWAYSDLSFFLERNLWFDSQYEVRGHVAQLSGILVDMPVHLHPNVIIHMPETDRQNETYPSKQNIIDIHFVPERYCMITVNRTLLRSCGVKKLNCCSSICWCIPAGSLLNIKQHRNRRAEWMSCVTQWHIHNLYRKQPGDATRPLPLLLVLKWASGIQTTVILWRNKLRYVKV